MNNLTHINGIGVVRVPPYSLQGLLKIAVGSHSAAPVEAVKHAFSKNRTLPLVHGILLALQYVMQDVKGLRLMKPSPSGDASAAPSVTTLRHWRHFVSSCLHECMRGYKIATLVVAEADTQALVVGSDVSAIVDAPEADDRSTAAIGPSGVRLV